MFQISFHYPYIFYATLLLVAGILIYTFFRTQSQNFLVSEALKKVYQKQSLWHKVFFVLLCNITLLFGVLLAGPHSILESKTVKKNGIDIEIVFDVSTSMLADDLRPNRLEIAKAVIGDFVGELESDRLGLILFAGKPFQSIPLSYDYDFIREFVSDIDIYAIDQSEIILRGTAIGDGLLLASDILTSDNLEREKVIILITDGEANKGLEPTAALAYVKQQGIKTYTIGVGKDEETYIIQNVGNNKRKTQIGGVDEELLKKIAEETGGKYFRADSSGTFHMILQTIGELEKKEIEYEELTLISEKYRMFIFLLLLHFFLLFYIIWVKKIRF